jgi:signal transduction histidine kinase
LVVRLRRSRDDVRRQLLWIASSAAFLALGVVVILLVPRITGVEGTWLAALPLRVGQVVVPLCVAVAILRHRLLDIDVIVNRALVLAIATALAAVGYVLVVVTVGLAVGTGARGFWPSLLATAVVALAFQPLRTRVVHVADRLAFGSSAAPYEALADFSRRLGNSPDPSTMLPEVSEAAARAVGAAQVTAVLHVESGTDLTAAWPAGEVSDPGSTDLQIPVLHLAERLGSITVTMPPGHPLRRRERQLLTDLADQAGLAFRHARLTAELSSQVAQLGQRTDELGDSRRRLISAGDAERSRLEHAIAGQVVPHVLALPDQLRRLSVTGISRTPSSDDTDLDPLLHSLSTALESLREITRGVFPAQLARSGLAAALESLFSRTGGSTRLLVDAGVAGRRFDARVEAAAYFCVAEATQDLRAPVVVVLAAADGELAVAISGSDGGGLRLDHIRDRIEATGGRVAVSSADGRIALDAWLPDPVATAACHVAHAGPQPVASAHTCRSRSGPSEDFVT